MAGYLKGPNGEHLDVGCLASLFFDVSNRDVHEEFSRDHSIKAEQHLAMVKVSGDLLVFVVRHVAMRANID